MCIKFESRKICVAGNECDNSDLDFCNAEHKELPCYDGRRTTNKLKHQQAFNLGSSKSTHWTTRSGLQRIVSRDAYEAKNNTMMS